MVIFLWLQNRPKKGTPKDRPTWSQLDGCWATGNGILFAFLLRSQTTEPYSETKSKPGIKRVYPNWQKTASCRTYLFLARRTAQTQIFFLPLAQIRATTKTKDVPDFIDVKNYNDFGGGPSGFDGAKKLPVPQPRQESHHVRLLLASGVSCVECELRHARDVGHSRPFCAERVLPYYFVPRKAPLPHHTRKVAA